MQHSKHIDTLDRAVPSSFADIAARFLDRFAAKHGRAEFLEAGDIQLIPIRDLADHWAVVETQSGIFLKCGGDGIVTTDDLIHGDAQ